MSVQLLLNASMFGAYLTNDHVIGNISVLFAVLNVMICKLWLGSEFDVIQVFVCLLIDYRHNVTELIPHVDYQVGKLTSEDTVIMAEVAILLD